MAETIAADVTEENLKNDDESSKPQTDWPSIRLLSLIIFLSLIQMTVINMSEWPYMKQIDPQATSTFFGYVTSVSSLAHAIFAPLMGYWSSVTGQMKLSLILGRLVAMIGCFFYLGLELFSNDARYVMLLCYAIFGISMSSVSAMRGYIAKISTVEERTVAISIFRLAITLAVVIGPDKL